MTRDEALYWFHLGRHGCEGQDEMTAFDSLWGSRFKEVEPIDEWTVNAVCDGDLHMVGSESFCNECGFTCNWLHEPRSHKPIAVERSEDKVEDSPVDPVVDVAAETVDFERCGGALYDSWMLGCRVCSTCTKIYTAERALSTDYRCDRLV